MKKVRAVLGVASIFGSMAIQVDGQSPADQFADQRDGQVYETVRIGDQIWIARNLNFSYGSKTCYDNAPDFCIKYGALYSWEEAMEVCPDGWHLPSKDEWEVLIGHLGVADAGQKLKASPDDAIPWDGTNETGFTALSAGAGNGEGFHRMGDWALFWSSTESSTERAWFTQLDGYWYQVPAKYTKLYVGSYYLKTNQFSVRCIKDQD